MVANMKTEAPDVTPDLPDITPQQFEFVKRIVYDGMKLTEAYREAYNPTDDRAPWVWTEASRTRALPEVSLWISTLRKQSVQAGNYSLEDHIAELDAAIEMCRESGNMGAMVNAMKAKGAAKGFYVALHEDVTKRQRSPAEMIDEIRAKLGDEAADVLARGLGVEPLKRTA